MLGDLDDPALEVANVSKAYGATRALRNVSFDVRRGEIHGLCGHNGAGKSTLMRVIVGLEQPDKGEIRLAGRRIRLHGTAEAQKHGIGFVDQEVSLIPELTVAENVFLGDVSAGFLTRRSLQYEVTRQVLRRAGLEYIPPERLCAELSVAERQLLEVARLLQRDVELLVLDEPTAALTDAETERVFSAVRSVVTSGPSVIFVSHRLDEVLALCNRITVLRDGRKIATRAVRDVSKDSLVEMMLGTEGTDENKNDIKRRVVPWAGPRGGGALCVRNLRCGRAAAGFDFDARSGAIVALAGQIGAGGSSILRAIAGLDPDALGKVVIDGRAIVFGLPAEAVRAGIFYVPRERKDEGLFLGQTVEYNLLVTRLRTLTRLGILQRGRARKRANELARLVGVNSSRMHVPVNTLSGGNQQRVLVGRSLDQRALRVLLLDDPTRGVDVGGRTKIHRIIRGAAASGAVILFASSDLDEVLELADVVITLFGGRLVSQRESRSVTREELLHETTHRI